MIRHLIIPALNKIPKRKRRIQLLVLLLLLLIMFFHDKKNTADFIILPMLFLFPIYMLMRIFVLLPMIKKNVVRRYWRLVINTRKFYRLSLVTEFLLYIASAFVALHLPYTYISKNYNNYLLEIGMSIFALAAILDIKCRCEWIVKKTWARLAGKILLAGIGTISYYAATTLAKNLFTEITHSDSHFFPEITSIIAALYTPIIYVFIITTIVLVVTMLEWLAIITPLIIIMPAQILASKYIKRTLQRLITGKKNLSPEEKRNLEAKKIIMAPRFAAPLCLVYLFFMAIQNIYSLSSPPLDFIVKKYLIELHYHNNYQCSNLSHKEKIAELEKGMVSVARFKENNVSFEEHQCETSSFSKN